MTLTKININSLFNPGIYEIKSILNGKVYIGESENVLGRLGKHTEDLKNNRHDCFELQKDFNDHGKEAFIFQALLLDPIYKNSKKRKQKEQQLIKNSKNCYNRLNNFKVAWQSYQPVQINNQIYEGLRAASRALKESRTNIKRKCLDESITNYKFINSSEPQNVYKKRSKPCMIHNVFYDSIKNAAEKTKLSSSTIRRRCMDKTNHKYKFVERSND